MDFSGFQKMAEAWTRGGQFGEPIMTGCEILALTICLVYSTRTNLGKAFFLYILFDFSIGLFDYYLKYFSEAPQKKSNDIIYITNSFISVVELCVYYYFFFRVLQNIIVKHAMKFLLIVFMIFFVGLIISNTKKIDSYGHFSGIIGAAEFLFLLLPCFTYYFELFSMKTSEDLLKRPSFWIVTGIFFYSVVSIPYYLIANFLAVNKYHSQSELAIFMFYIPFSISFLFLTKAFLCKKPLTI